MSFHKKLTRAGLALGLAATFTATAAFAQQPTTTQSEAGQQTPHHRHMEGDGAIHGDHMRGGRMMFGLRELDLTDAQKQQVQAIAQRYAESTKPQREELRSLYEQKKQGTLTADGQARLKALHEAFRQSETSLQTEILAVLTPEQRAKHDQLVKEREARREQWRQQHQTDKAPSTTPQQ